jgi:uncharacterized protein (TIGR00255 family)
MALSMTGYGRHKEINGGFDITVEIKAVNHRYFDTNIRLPRSFSFLEEIVRKYLSEKINRGKLDVYIHINNIEDGGKSVSLNKAVCESYINVLKEISDEFSVPYDVTVTKLARFSDIFETGYVEYATDEIFPVIEPVLKKALNDFLDMRQKEGARLSADMSARIENLKSLSARLEELLPASVREYENKLREKMEEYIGGASFDENRLMTEVAIFSDKVATYEETTRLSSHFAEFSDLIKKDMPVGKKLDFVVQEMNREINTVCSKCQNLEISKIGIDAKTEIEAIREQVQNIE